jgi:threonine dehydrogenase-like Zn-dependent dehydrogenase
VRALVYTEERTLDVLDVDTPAPAEDEVLIEVERAGICGSDVQGVATRSPRRMPPLIMGHELVGRVVAAGPGAGSVAGEAVDARPKDRLAFGAPGGDGLVGRRVAVNPQVPCGTCLSCRSGSENVCRDRELVGGTRPGGFGELVAVPVRCVHVVEEGLDADVAVLAEPVATCIHALRLSPLAFPGTVVVLGAGTIGMLACIVARLHGAGRIVVSETSDERRAWAAPLADAVVEPGEVEAAVPDGAELVVDAVGADSTRAASVALLRPGGCALWLGMHDAEATIPAFDLVVREQTIRGSFAYTDADFARAVELLAEHPDAFRLPTRTCTLDEGARVFEALVAGTTDGFVKASLAP